MPSNKLSHKFFKQRLGEIPMLFGYWPEVGALNLGIKDKEGNTITFYRKDYITMLKRLNLQAVPSSDKTKAKSYNDALVQFVAERNVDLPGLVTLVKELNRTRKAGEYEIELVKYLGKEYLNQCRIEVGSNFAPESIVRDFSGKPLKKNGHQNCIVLINNEIYVHPKIRAKIADDVIGVNHSSLANGQMVAFAGSLVHTDKHGWVLENTSGHYGTRVTQIRNFLEKLSAKTNLADLKVKLKLSEEEKKDEGEDEQLEDAAHFLKRTAHVLDLIAAQKPRPRRNKQVLGQAEGNVVPVMMEPSITKGVPT